MGMLLSRHYKQRELGQTSVPGIGEESTDNTIAQNLENAKKLAGDGHTANLPPKIEPVDLRKLDMKGLQLEAEKRGIDHKGMKLTSKAKLVEALERRERDQDKALETAFAQGVLPEEDRRLSTVRLEAEKQAHETTGQRSGADALAATSEQIAEKVDQGVKPEDINPDHPPQWMSGPSPESTAPDRGEATVGPGLPDIPIIGPGESDHPRKESTPRELTPGEQKEPETPAPGEPSKPAPTPAPRGGSKKAEEKAK